MTIELRGTNASYIAHDKDNGDDSNCASQKRV